MKLNSSMLFIVVDIVVFALCRLYLKNGLSRLLILSSNTTGNPTFYIWSSNNDAYFNS